MSIEARDAITKVLSHAEGARHEFILSTVRGSYRIDPSEAEAELSKMVKEEVLNSKPAGEGEHQTIVYWLKEAN